MKGKIAKPLLFFFLLLVLAMPLLQHVFKVVESGKLSGDVRNAPDTSITLKGWWEGGYQHAKGDYLNDNMGFRPDFVRLNNQLDYSLFGKLHANGVVEGKEHYLYEKGYIDIYCGKGYMGDDSVRQEMYLLKRIQDTLTKMGKSLVVAFAPSKARYYPEYIPARLYCNSTEHNIYTVSRRLADSFGINLLDLNGWFVQMKPTTKYPLFNKLGTHWSKYGSVIASDTLLGYIEKLRGIKLPRIKITSVETTDQPIENENDISAGLNLIQPVAKEVYAHPQFHYTEDSGRVELKTIFIGDSFTWSLLYNNLPQHLSKQWEIWFYFNEVWSERLEHEYTGHYDWMKRIEQSDCIVILNTEVNMHSLGSGFVYRAYEKFYGKIKK